MIEIIHDASEKKRDDFFNIPVQDVEFKGVYGNLYYYDIHQISVDQKFFEELGEDISPENLKIIFEKSFNRPGMEKVFKNIKIKIDLKERGYLKKGGNDERKKRNN